MANVSWVESALRLPSWRTVLLLLLLLLVELFPGALILLHTFSGDCSPIVGFAVLPVYDTLEVPFRSSTLFSPPRKNRQNPVASASDKNFTLLSCCCFLILLLPESNTHNRAPHKKKLPPQQPESTPSVKVRQQQQSAALNVKFACSHAHHLSPKESVKKTTRKKEHNPRRRRHQVWTEFWATFGPDPEQPTGGLDGRHFHARDSTGAGTDWATLQRTRA